MFKSAETAPDERSDLFKKDGLYHVRLYRRHGAEPIEVALHGISSEENARTVLNHFNQPGPQEFPEPAV